MGDESRGRAHGLVGVCVALALCLGAAGTLGWFASVAPASPVAEPAPETGAAGALSRAREQLAAGEPAVAISTLEGLGAVELVEDYRLLLLARAQAAAGDPEAVVATSDAFVREHAHSPLRGAMGRVRGDAQAELGVEARARTAWADAARRTRDEDERAELLALQARSYERERARPDA
ncbi:MAG: hypothetical protein QNK05_22225, partial [Myxococcota bacterium]|nr:hypothetical protein [Myxococcota bacterium]